jgi:putative FmdB family regulatory protein
MPIYEYRCSECGFQKEYLQKLSDAPLKVCPECGKSTFGKMVTAAGFQLKGTGWYVTDFRNKGSGSASAGHDKAPKKTETESVKSEPVKTESPKTESPKTGSGGSAADHPASG